MNITISVSIILNFLGINIDKKADTLIPLLNLFLHKYLLNSSALGTKKCIIVSSSIK